eukprot:SAG31_NODE_4864_length_2900_cov_1.249554_4_plen_247_part_00
MTFSILCLFLHLFRSDILLTPNDATGHYLWVKLDPHFRATAGLLLGLRVKYEFSIICEADEKETQTAEFERSSLAEMSPPARLELHVGRSKSEHTTSGTATVNMAQEMPDAQLQSCAYANPISDGSSLPDSYASLSTPDPLAQSRMQIDFDQAQHDQSPAGEFRAMRARNKELQAQLKLERMERHRLEKELQQLRRGNSSSPGSAGESTASLQTPSPGNDLSTVRKTRRPFKRNGSPDAKVGSLDR